MRIILFILSAIFIIFFVAVSANIDNAKYNATTLNLDPEIFAYFKGGDRLEFIDINLDRGDDRDDAIKRNRKFKINRDFAIICTRIDKLNLSIDSAKSVMVLLSGILCLSTALIMGKLENIRAELAKKSAPEKEESKEEPGGTEG